MLGKGALLSCLFGTVMDVVVECYHEWLPCRRSTWRLSTLRIGPCPWGNSTSTPSLALFACVILHRTLKYLMDLEGVRDNVVPHRLMVLFNYCSIHEAPQKYDPTIQVTSIDYLDACLVEKDITLCLLAKTTFRDNNTTIAFLSLSANPAQIGLLQLNRLGYEVVGDDLVYSFLRTCQAFACKGSYSFKQMGYLGYRPMLYTPISCCAGYLSLDLTKEKGSQRWHVRRLEVVNRP